MDKPGVSQKALLIKEDGTFLVLLRGSTAPSNPLKWDLPGGDVDFGEEPDESIRREVREETGLEVGELKLFDVEAEVNPAGYHWFTLAYQARVTTDQVKISWEHDEYRWVDIGEFLQLPSFSKIIRFVKNAFS